MEYVSSAEVLKRMRKRRYPNAESIAEVMAADFPGRSLKTIATDVSVIERCGVDVIGPDFERRTVPFSAVMAAYLRANGATADDVAALRRCYDAKYGYLLELISPDSSGAGRYQPASSAGTHSGP